MTEHAETDGPRPDPERDTEGDAELDELETETVADLEVDEEAEDVAGGDMCSATPSICDTL